MPAAPARAASASARSQRERARDEAAWLVMGAGRGGVLRAAGQGLGGREDLAAEPRLQAADLKAVGVDKLGHQRKIARMIAAL